MSTRLDDVAPFLACSWDVLWFIPVARRGYYAVEQETAFGWGWIWVMRVGGKLLGWLSGTKPLQGQVEIHHVVTAGVICSWTAGILAGLVLYLLTLRLTASRQFAKLTWMLYILSPSPGPSISPYTEPMYALLSFSGMLLLAPSHASLAMQRAAVDSIRWKEAVKGLVAVGCFAGATAVRPLGVMNVGYLGWELIVRPLYIQPVTWRKRFLLACLFALSAPAVFAPFVFSQIQLYQQFCLDVPSLNLTPEWCARRMPVVYTYVQEKYWNVGFLRYFTLPQIPNFLLSAPIYILLVYTHFSSLPSLVLPIPFMPRSVFLALNRPSSIIQERWIMPYVIHSIVWSAILFFTSHVQIILRLAQTNPVVWWGAAALVSGRQRSIGRRDRNQDGKDFEMGMGGRVYLGWLVFWIPVSIVLWAGFYPPA
ncbi:Predicted Dolichyl-phosphate-mannose-protein mannosyltransferase [Phaffia rhodozyma]|uniref:GPI mannosyltransferase 2 n=1 Tax=Phaffia rhodozyma TaxID=264483 RepID=A0A0F7SS44_PHARH|nr:Predicted Dolichyl-phosphate-mannose-protein mannosyltransferase [Phaffia rhodozyma]